MSSYTEVTVTVKLTERNMSILDQAVENMNATIEQLRGSDVVKGNSLPRQQWTIEKELESAIIMHISALRKTLPQNQIAYTPAQTPTPES